ncbi:MAG TPA: phospholipase D-like domain-containing protein [Candidatus Acidoferrales bacterium]|nr:phospholipase D-like domain-containing protein [Candidatus Acidoferrales bacterium]
MKLIVEPNDGVAPLVSAIRKATKTIEIAIFRFDYRAIEAELQAAAARAVKVIVLIASVNRGGVESLRKLELRCLAAGLSVGRTNDDLVRYHDKFIIIDRRTLYLLSFNFTRIDIERSRGFGIVTRNAQWVQEAAALFEADRWRRRFTPRSNRFVVSPCNGRSVLARFLRRARKQLLIYDPNISDKEMLGILRARQKANVEIRVIGHVAGSLQAEVRQLAAIRLHTRTIIRDRHQAFIGSQSLRASELDRRRELGLIIQDAKAVNKLADTFESDWQGSERDAKRHDPEKSKPASDESKARETAKVLAEELDPLTSSLKRTVKRVVLGAGEEALEEKEVTSTVKKIVKKAVKEAIHEVARDTKV